MCTTWLRCSLDKIDTWALLTTTPREIAGGNGHATLGKKGSRPGKMRSPSALAVLGGGGSAEGGVGIAPGTLGLIDSTNRRIQLIQPEVASRPSSSIGVGDVSATIESAAHISCPTGLAFDARDGTLLVADNTSHRLCRLAMPSGALLSSTGGHGRDSDALWDPEAVAIDDDGRVYVADSGNHRIVVYEVDAQGELTRKHAFGKMGLGGAGELASPFGVAVAPRALGGLVYVADTVLNRVCLFTREGKFVRSVGGRRPLGARRRADRLPPGHFELPRNLAIVRECLVVVEVRRVQVLQLTSLQTRQVIEFGGGPHGLRPMPTAAIAMAPTTDHPTRTASAIMWSGAATRRALRRDADHGAPITAGAGMAAAAAARASPMTQPGAAVDEEPSLWGVAATDDCLLVTDVGRHRLHAFTLRHPAASG